MQKLSNRLSPNLLERERDGIQHCRNAAMSEQRYFSLKVFVSVFRQRQTDCQMTVLSEYSITRIYATRLKENSAICKRFWGSRPRAFFASLVKTRLKATRIYANSLICKYFYGPTRPFNSLKCKQSNLYSAQQDVRH